MGVVSASEKEIIERFLTGSEVGFEELVAHFEKKIYSLCLSLTQSEADAEAVLSAVFCRALDELHSVVKSNISLTNWFYRITVEAAADREPMHHPDFETGARCTMLDVVNAAVEQHYEETGDERALFRAAIHNLPYEYRSIYLLHEALGLPLQDIEEILGLSELEARAFLHRSRLMICRYLQRFRGTEYQVANLRSRSLKRNSNSALI